MSSYRFSEQHLNVLRCFNETYLRINFCCTVITLGLFLVDKLLLRHCY